jgi:hypothetical protein
MIQQPVLVLYLAVSRLVFFLFFFVLVSLRRNGPRPLDTAYGADRTGDGRLERQ